jgi:Rrf2 family iron-sulfur cluster assembly transcriptional regulator
MKLTTRGRYAVQALADIAAAGPASLVALSEIAERQAISIGYLEQLFARLRRAGLVESVRGVAGGYRLARPAGSIAIADIVGAAAEDIQTTACQGSAAGCRGTGARCLTHDLWEELGRHIDLFLNAVTLEDVVEGRVVGVASVNRPTKRAARAAVAQFEGAVK